MKSEAVTVPVIVDGKTGLVDFSIQSKFGVVGLRLDAGLGEKLAKVASRRPWILRPAGGRCIGSRYSDPTTRPKPAFDILGSQVRLVTPFEIA